MSFDNRLLEFVNGLKQLLLLLILELRPLQYLLPESVHELLPLGQFLLARVNRRLFFHQLL